MLLHLTFAHHAPTRWAISHGTREVGAVAPERITITGFPDRASAAAAADVARRVVREWRMGSARTQVPGQFAVTLTSDAHGFTCALPDNLWRALQIELAQRLHVATQPFRTLNQEIAV